MLHDFSVQKLEWDALLPTENRLLFEDVRNANRFQDRMQSIQHRFSRIHFSFPCSNKHTQNKTKTEYKVQSAGYNHCLLGFGGRTALM